jgi:hypothetical protein
MIALVPVVDIQVGALLVATLQNLTTSETTVVSWVVLSVDRAPGHVTLRTLRATPLGHGGFRIDERTDTLPEAATLPMARP